MTDEQKLELVRQLIKEVVQSTNDINFRGGVSDSQCKREARAAKALLKELLGRTPAEAEIQGILEL